MAWMLGAIFGAILAGALFTRLVWWLLGLALKMTDDVPRAVATALISYPLMIVLGGWGNADGGPWNPGPFWVTYLFAVALFFVGDLWRINKAKARAKPFG